MKLGERVPIGAAVVATLLVSPAGWAEEISSAALPTARTWQVSAGAGLLLPTEVTAHLRTGTEPSASFHADATLPGPLLEYGAYLREVRLQSSDTGGTASLFTVGAQAKYELRLRPWCILRVGVLVGLHDLSSDTIDNALGLDLGAALEWAGHITPHLRLRLAVQGTSMVVGGVPSGSLAVGFRATAGVIAGAEYAFR